MSKRIPAPIADAMLQVSEGDTIYLCSAEPANFAGLAAVTLAVAAIVGNYTLGAGTPSGREDELDAQSAVPVTADGTGNHVAVSNGGTDLQIVTTSTPIAVTNGGTVDLSSWALTLPDPT